MVFFSSAALRSTRSRLAPRRSVSWSWAPWRAAPSSCAPARLLWLRSLIDRSASRRSRPRRSSRVRLLPRIVTPRHWPPWIFIGRIVHSSKTLPSSLQPANVASKKLLRLKSQATNALFSCRLALNRQLWNAQDSKVAPLVVASEKSTSTNLVFSWRTSPSWSPYQSSPRISDNDGAARPPVRSGLARQERLVDQVAPQRREVGVELAQDLVDGRLRIVLASSNDCAMWSSTTSRLDRFAGIVCSRPSAVRKCCNTCSSMSRP